MRSRLAAAVLALAACAERLPQPSPEVDRLETLDRAVRLRAADPAAAAELFQEAGPGTVLERVRLELWQGALERSNAGVREWQDFLACGLPPDLALRARLGLARRLAAESRAGEAVALLEGAPPVDRVPADLALLELGEGPWRRSAAARLAVAAPGRLRRAAPELERAAVAELDPESRLVRSAAWRAAGSPARAAAELEGERWRGDLERRRRLELARAETAAGSPERALRVLQGSAAGDAEAQLLRGEAHRRQGWQRSPRPAARGLFTSCLGAAQRAVTAAGGSRSVEGAALELVVECGTEAGRLGEALDAWWRVEAIGWSGDRREWVGRRLGVALARAGFGRRELAHLAGALPEHERCLSFWSATAARSGAGELSELADVVYPDLYGLWARELTGRPAPASPPSAPAVEPAAPPWSVSWLLERGLLDEAAAEWRRICSARGTWPAEGLAEAALAERRGRGIEVVRVLRGAMPQLGGVRMDRAPANALSAYLPLPWSAELAVAAVESGVEPWLLAGVARQESVFMAGARSPAGAIGIMQLLPSTARGHAVALGFGAGPDLEQPGPNLRIGARELKRLLDRFEAVEPALAAYNAGEGRVRRWLEEEPDRFRFTEAIPIPETYSYVRRVRAFAEAYRVLYAGSWASPP
jgi:soluble lytic murein transglycosylase-like protein